MRRIAAGKSGEVFGLTNAEAGRVPLLSQVDRDINRRYWESRGYVITSALDWCRAQQSARWDEADGGSSLTFCAGGGRSVSLG